MEVFLDLFTTEFAGNTGQQYIFAIGTFGVLLFVLKIVQLILLSKLAKLAQKSKTKLDDLVIEIFRGVKPPFYFFISLYLALQWLHIPDIIHKVIYVLIILFVIYEIIVAIQKMIDFFLQGYIKKLEKEEKKKTATQTTQMVRALQILANIVIWAIGIILILSNLGFEVTSLIASLGIGGIAVALAVQNILSDLFSSFSLYVDKPFEVGDFISIGTDAGTVEKIGLKTTRLKTLQGEELIVSNRELTSVRIQNFKRLKKRRVVVSLGVMYSTEYKKLEKIPSLLEQIITKVKNVEFGRCHFDKYGDSALLYEVVYFVNSSDYDLYMDVKQQINLALFETFQKEGIAFAFPTQSVYVESFPKE